ncbi:MAG: amidohydrolase family protein [Bacteroidetes bacterium]|nr:amidohydrolase family protein [Bacteroidota bacterium]MBU1678274.1 amidohydrolase family protein [Bacteroidota bacterium]MBU2507648.1 amidohydrolase family protein [Bacteroidota bacterium]
MKKQNKIVIIPKQIVTANAEMEIYRDKALVISNGVIEQFVSKTEVGNITDAEIFRFDNFTLIPGFVQTHVHLCQTMFRGLADDLELLDWLQQKIFVFENQHNFDSLKASAKLGLYEFQKGGTTTILDMGTLRFQEAVFDEIINSKQRGFSGKCMIDENTLLPSFKESFDSEIRNTIKLAETYHNSNKGRIKYGFAPRFVLSCSEKLLIDTFDMLNDFEGSLYHTHSAENLNEIDAVRELRGKENIEYFDSIGVLSENTVLAHCVHVNDKEIEQLVQSQTRVAHCPSSNLKLGSGIADIPRFLDENISVSLGADGAPCNNNLSMFTEMRLAALIQKPIYGPTSMDAETVFRLATIEGAKALHLEDQVGSLEIGKKADLVLLDLEQPSNCLIDDNKNIYSDIVYASRVDSVREVMIDGDWVVKNSESCVYDGEEIVRDAKAELTKLLKRIGA